MAAENADLKRLAAVPETASTALSWATYAYLSVRGYCPASLQPTVAATEEKVSALAAPYLARAQDKGSELLKAADERVDKALVQANSVYASNSAYLASQLEKQRAAHVANLESYRAARETYLKKVEESVEFLKANGLSGAARRAADEALAAAAEARKLPSALLRTVHDAVDRLLAAGPVHSAAAAVRPGLEAARSQAVGAYARLHDTLVASPQYARALTLGQQAVARAEGTALYKTVSERVYPAVAPYADPALAAVSSSPYFKAAVDHLAPRPAAIAAQ